MRTFLIFYANINFIYLIYLCFYSIAIVVTAFQNPKAIPLSPPIHRPGHKPLVAKRVCTPSIHVFNGRPLLLLYVGINFIICFSHNSSDILFMHLYSGICSLFFCPIAHIYRDVFLYHNFLNVFLFYFSDSQCLLSDHFTRNLSLSSSITFSYVSNLSPC